MNPTVFNKEKGLVAVDSDGENIYTENVQEHYTERLSSAVKDQFAADVEAETGQKVHKIKVFTNWHRKGGIGGGFSSGFKIDEYVKSSLKNTWNKVYSTTRTNK